jgi:hypothetical protein
MEEIKKGVVFSNDINLILNGKNSLNYKYNEKGIIVPTDSFIRDLRDDFKKISKRTYGDDVVIIDEYAMSYYMNMFLDKFKEKYPIVSMDDIYVTCDNKRVFSLDCTRMSGSKDMVPRSNPLDKDGVRKQIEKLAEIFKSQNEKEIMLLDDVIFSGSVIEYISKIFKENGIDVVGAIAAISSIDGYTMFNGLKEKVNCGYLMEKDVLDEICERDFYYGIAQSGMARLVDGKVYKAPYFMPFGDPVARASVPLDRKEYFSTMCVNLSLDLWEEIERLSKREIMNNELPERILNTDYNEGVVKTLRKVLK